VRQEDCEFEASLSCFKKKTRKVKKAGEVAEVVEHLPLKCEALSSNPKTIEERPKKLESGQKPLPAGWTGLPTWPH
jgi:hypothetical protein